MNAPRVDNLTRKQEAAITALLTETTIERAAKAAGVATRTLYNWLDQPGFSRAFRRARRQAFNQATSLAQRYAPMAVNALAKIIMDESAPHSAKARAAAIMLKFGRESIELDELAARVDDLEEAASDGATFGMAG